MLKKILSFSRYLIPRKTETYLLKIRELTLAVWDSAMELKYLGEKEHPYTTAKKIKELEEKADKIVHDVNVMLLYDHTRVTEEKEDIQVFLHNLDNVIDNIEGAAWRIANIEPNTLALQIRDDFNSLVESSIDSILLSVDMLKDVLGHQEDLSKEIENINHKENRGDDVYREWLLRLVRRDFRDEGERLLLLEILERLEQVLDSAEDVADNLGTFVVKGGI